MGTPWKWKWNQLRKHKEHTQPQMEQPTGQISPNNCNKTIDDSLMPQINIENKSIFIMYAIQRDSDQLT